jgi:hypothetical protein
MKPAAKSVFLPELPIPPFPLSRLCQEEAHERILTAGYGRTFLARWRAGWPRLCSRLLLVCR